MKKWLKYLILSLFFLYPLFVFGKVTCSNGSFKATISVDKEQLTLQETTQVQIETDREYDVTYKSKDESIIEIDNKGLITPKNIGETSVLINVNFIDENDETVSCGSIINIKVLSNDSSLKSLEIEGFELNPKFDSQTFLYNLSIPYKYEKININAEPTSDSSSVSGTGRKYLNDGMNIFTIYVEANDKTSTKYQLNVNREAANNDSTLSSLYVDGYILTPFFSPKIKEYSLRVDKNIEEIMIKATPTFEQAKIKGIGKVKLATGKNVFTIYVVAENGDINSYRLIVNRNIGKSKLTKLVIDNQNLNEIFDSEHFTYNTVINSNINKLNIIAQSENNEQIEIIGNDKLKEGTNEILIRVSSDETSPTTYKIIVTKLSKEEEIKIRNHKLLVNILLVMFLILVVFMISSVIFFIIRIYINKKKYKEKLKKIKNIRF